MNEKLSFLASEALGEPEVTSAETPATTASSTEAAMAATPSEVDSAPSGFRASEPGHVPISALLDEREKRQAERAAREILERQLAELSAMVAPEAPPSQEESVRQALYAQNMRASRRFAEREYGRETVATVHAWAASRCDEDPYFNQQIFASEDPYETALQAYARDQIVAQVQPDDFAAFKAWQAAQAVVAGRSAHHPPTARTPSVPRSLANAPGNGAAGAAHVPNGPGQAFASVIPR